jgi:hypothetical protein
MWTKRFLGLLISTIGVFMCVYSRVTFYHIYSILTIEEKVLDYDLVSIEDYTITARVNKNFYDAVTNPNKNSDNVDKDELQEPSKLAKFKEKLQNGLENELIKAEKKKIKKANKKNKAIKPLDPEKLRVADISFAFDNREMLILLEKRYESLAKTDFETVSEIEKELSLLNQDKYDQYIVPNTFYCTFMHGEGQ